MKITPLDIRKQEFKKVFKGYDKHEVDIFLEMVAKEMEDLIKENTALIEQVRELEAKIEDYRRMEKTLQDTLTSAQRTTDELRRKAEREAENIIKNAKLEAEKILNEAHKKMQDLLSQISALKSQRDAFISQFRGFLEAQLRMLMEMEEGKKEEKEEVQIRRVKKEATLKDIGDLFESKD